MTKIRSNIKENMKHSLFPILLFISIQFITFADEKKESYTNLSAQKTKALINDYKAKSKKLTIIDVRTIKRVILPTQGLLISSIVISRIKLKI